MNTITINQAFEQILNQIDATKQLAADKGDMAQWRANHNAFTKAALHFAEGMRPLWTGSSYLVRSATRPDAVVHRVRRAGSFWACSCEAGSNGRPCWHAALAIALDQAEPQQEQDAVAAMVELF